MVKQGTRVIEGVDVAVTSIDSLATAPSLDASNNQIKASLAAIDASANATKNSVAAIDASANAIKGSVAYLPAIDASANAIKNSVSNLDVSINWGRNAKPAWQHADISINALAGSDLVTKTVGAGKQGFIYGWMITSEDNSNNFTLNWVSGGVSKSILIVFGGPGTAENQEQGVALNEDTPASQNTNITVKNTVAAGTSKRHQARILVAEV